MPKSAPKREPFNIVQGNFVEGYEIKNSGFNQFIQSLKIYFVSLLILSHFSGFPYVRGSKVRRMGWEGKKMGCCLPLKGRSRTWPFPPPNSTFGSVFQSSDAGFFSVRKSKKKTPPPPPVPVGWFFFVSPLPPPPQVEFFELMVRAGCHHPLFFVLLAEVKWI